MFAVTVREILRRADGWLDLGCPEEALKELEALPDCLHATREVLKVKCRVLYVAENWGELLNLSAMCAQHFPQDACFHEDWAWAQHKLGNTEQAYQELSHRSAKFPETWRTAYYLACFAYLLKQVESATVWLARALFSHPRPSQLQSIIPLEPAFAPNPG